MHILPQGYTRSRSYGGYHGSRRQDYLERCRALLETATCPSPPSPQRVEPSAPQCPRCKLEMHCIRQQRRPSWRDIFQRQIYADASLYSPMHHLGHQGPRAFPYEPDG
jgi:hypothetical protein